MRYRLFYIFLSLILFSFKTFIYSQCYELIWSDEFEYTGFPDTEHWSFEVGGSGWGNNELQYYKKNDEDNSWVENGKLRITAINESYGGRNYTSARLITRDKFDFRYGKIEARLKLPYGQGIWPAFWIMGKNISDVGWPACGEIDVMEMVGGEGRNNEIHGTAHWDNNGSYAQYGGSYSLNEGIFADTFHTFSLEWNPSAIRWYVDGIQYHVMSITPAGLSEFHNDFFILLNLAVGGIWPGNPDATTVFPQTMEVDYVRVYKTKQQVGELDIEGEESLPAKASGRKYSFPGASDWTYEWEVPPDAEITVGQGTSDIEINWGCSDGLISCKITGNCEDYYFEKNISAQNHIYGPVFITPGEENVLFFTDSLMDSEFEWIVPTDAEVLEKQGTDSVFVNWGNSFEAVELIITNSCGSDTLSYTPVKAGQYPYPEISIPQKIPGIIEAVNYDYGGEGIAYHDLSNWNEGPGPRQEEYVDTEYNDNGNPNVGWIRSGEWIEYSVSVDSASWYRVRMRVATANSSGGPFSVLFNDKVKLDGIKVNGTGAWDSFTTIDAGTLYLTPEDSLMRLDFNVGDFNLGKLTFIPTVDPTISISNNFHENLLVYPIPANEYLTISCDSGIDEVLFLDMNGRIILHNKSTKFNRAVLDVENIDAGIYLVKIITSKGSVYHRRILISGIN